MFMYVVCVPLSLFSLLLNHHSEPERIMMSIKQQNSKTVLFHLTDELRTVKRFESIQIKTLG